MPDYGKLEYWRERYSRDANEPFDWMCDWEQLEPTLKNLMPSKPKAKSKVKVLIVGCGNAPFSHDFVTLGGFQNTIHIDYCDVVIEQQRQKHPDLDWRIMDALDMPTFEDGSFDYIIDKSLIDTMLCYANGHETAHRLYRELHRVLKSGGRLVTISLHNESEIREFQHDFIVSTCKIENLRRGDDDNDIRCLYHSLGVYDKVEGLDDEAKDKILKSHPIKFQQALSDEDYYSMIEEIMYREELAKEERGETYLNCDDDDDGDGDYTHLISMRSIPMEDRWSTRTLNDEEYYQIIEDSLGEDGDANESLLVSSRSFISEPQKDAPNENDSPIDMGSQNEECQKQYVGSVQC